MTITAIEQVFQKCDELANLMIEKGVKKPDANVNFGSGNSSHIHIRADWTTKPFEGEGYRIFTDGCLAEQFESAFAYINALPSPETIVNVEYLKRVSSAIDYATENAIDEKMVSPLREVSKAMTENLLTSDGAK